MPKVYTCPKCGGKLKRTDTRCEYCGNTIYFDEEKSEFELYVEKNRFNKERNSDFDSDYHYYGKNKQKAKKKRLICWTVFLIVIAIVAIIIII